MEITPNELNHTQGQSQALDPKVIQLIKSLANTPLLLDKLVLNQSQGLVLKLVNQHDKLELQLPARVASRFENISQNTTSVSVSVSSASNQQILIKIFVSITSQAKQPNQAATNTDAQAAPQAKSVLTDTLQFRIAKLLDNQVLRLSNLNLTSSNLASGNLNTKNDASSKIADTNSLPQLDNQKSLQLLLDKNTSISTVARNILSRHYSKHVPISNHLSQIRDITKQLKAIPNPPLIIQKIVRQIEQLIESVKISSLPSGDNIKQRLLASGNLLEAGASQRLNDSLLQRNENTRNVANTTKTLFKNANVSTNNELIKENSQSKTTVSQNILTMPSKKTPSNDIKLQLMQIRATLESLLKNGLTRSSTSNSSSTSSANEPIAQNNPQSLVNMSVLDKTTEASATQKVLSHLLGSASNKSSPDNVRAELSLHQQNTALTQARELLNEVRNIVSQIENNQLNSLKSESPNLQQFLVDLPFGNEPDIDSFELLFKHFDDGQKRKIKQWKVVVRFDLEPLGPMFAQIELAGERISTHIFAKSQQTALLINEHMHVLKKSLSNAGVDIDQLKSSQGNIPEKLVQKDTNEVDLHV